MQLYGFLILADRNRVIIQRPEKGYTDYINAVYCNVSLYLSLESKY